MQCDVFELLSHIVSLAKRIAAFTSGSVSSIKIRRWPEAAVLDKPLVDGLLFERTRATITFGLWRLLVLHSCYDTIFDIYSSTDISLYRRH